MFVEANIEPRKIDVESVRILHDELASAKHTGFRPRFVAKLRLDLEPNLGKLPIAPELVTCDRGENLFMGHTEAIIALAPVFEPEHLVADLEPATALFPELPRMDDGKVELLRTDALHLLAHDGLHFARYAEAER